MSAADRSERHAALSLADQLDQREGPHRVNTTTATTLDRVLRGNAFEPHRPLRPHQRRSRHPLARLWRALLTYLAQPSPFRPRR